ncbi:MAG: glycine cleavage system protein GcvH [Desulfovibrio sp.]|jgi:glycine cleavage system H protein|nr:glycine cleavage system protein GcvH [Desulfovibrio sp.]
MSVKPDLLYSPSHEWARIEGNEAVLGITHFAQDQLGDITFIDLPAVGDTLAPGKEMGSVESVKAASDIYSPVAGEVVAVNEALENAPELMNQSPFDKGWMVRVRLSAQPSGLLDAKGYEEAVANEAH